MTELEAIIRQVITRDGPIPVARYMQLALQHPVHGYYMKGDPLGIAGDFTTAPEISQMFGELIGIWCAEMWRAMGRPTSFTLLEMGPGRGTLMHDALRATAKVAGFHEAMKLFLVESNETLQVKQMEKLGDYKPTYIPDLGQLPSQPLIVIANEFLDALPIHQYVKLDDGWRERMVGMEGDEFVFVNGTHDVFLPLPQDKSFYEISPMSVAIVQDIAAMISRFGGAGLFIDYGYSEAGSGDTLQAVSGHSSVPVLEKPGLVDLTAHVDFLALKLAAEKQGVRASEIITQEAFLKAMGIDLRAWQLKMKADYEQALAIDAGFERLMDASQMGNLFKAMAITAKNIKEIPGFP